MVFPTRARAIASPTGARLAGAGIADPRFLVYYAPRDIASRYLYKIALIRRPSSRSGEPLWKEGGSGAQVAVRGRARGIFYSLVLDL